jgi:hypothetical protein
MSTIQCLSWFEPFGAALARADERSLDADGLGPGRPNAAGVVEESYFLFGGVDETSPDHDEEVHIRGTRCVLPFVTSAVVGRNAYRQCSRVV